MNETQATPLVVHVIYRLATGGLENGVVNLINHLPADRYRHAIVCLTDATDFAKRITRNDVDVHALHMPPGNSVAIHWRFHALFRSLRPAIVHTRNLAALEAQPAAALARVPVRIHGEHGWEAAHPEGASRRQTAIRKLYSPFVHRYVPLSKQIERYLVDKVGIAPARVERICNGVDCTRFRPAPDARRSLPHAAFRCRDLVVIGTVGRMVSEKNHVILAEAFVEALRALPEARSFLRLAIVGSGPMQPKVEEVLHAGNARALAWLAGDRPDVHALLPAFDMFVQCSSIEGISNTILEAMASGLPVIATDVGGNAELVAADETGVLVPAPDVHAIRDAILNLATDGARRAYMADASRVRATTRFSLAEMVRRYGALYDTQLDRRFPPAARRAAPSRGVTID